MSSKSKRAEPFIMHYLAMRKSVAWKRLPDNARRVLDVLEQVNANHAGTRNGSLPCTFDQLAEVGGIRRQSVALAIRQAVELGFLEITFHAKPSVADHRRASEYRLTYIYNRNGKPEMTNEWKAIRTDADADRALARAADIKSPDHARRATKAVRDKQRESTTRRAA